MTRRERGEEPQGERRERRVLGIGWRRDPEEEDNEDRDPVLAHLARIRSEVGLLTRRVGQGHPNAKEALDEVERLHAEVERLRDLLTEVTAC